MIKSAKILLLNKENRIKFLALFSVVFLLFGLLYTARISSAENEIFYMADAIISVPFYFYLIGYICVFINGVFRGKNTLPEIDLKPFKIALNPTPFLLFVASCLVFIVVDDFIKSNIFFIVLVALNTLLYLPMSLFFLSFSENFSNNNLLKYFKTLDLKSCALCYLKIITVFVLFVLPCVVMINTSLPAIAQCVILTFLVYFAHVGLIIWFYDLTIFIKEKAEKD